MMTAPLDLLPFKQIVKLRCGLSMEGIGENTLAAAVRKRQAATGIASVPLYLARLTGNAAEFQELVALLTINETYFFRESDQIALVVDRLLPPALAASAGERRPVCILSAGCSTGEEPYSLAMAILDRFGEAAGGLVRIMGGDIDHHALARARAGRYGPFSFRGVDAALRDRYFRADGGGFVLDERVRRMVAFHHLNLLVEPFPAELHDLDIVMFRNVSIYFDQATRRAIQRNIHSVLRPGGSLVTGSAETLANDLGVFRMVQEQGAFYFVKAAPVPHAVVPLPRLDPSPVSQPVARPMAAVPPPPMAAVPPPPALETLRELIRAKRTAEALTGLTAARLLAPGDNRLRALEAYVHLVGRDFDAATTVAQAVVSEHPWSTDALMVLGLAAKWTERSDEALAWFKQTVYARHDCWPAHYHLAELQRGLGAHDAARRSYRLVLQQTAAGADPDGGLVLPLGLPVADVRFLCERRAAPAATAANTGRR